MAIPKAGPEPLPDLAAFLGPFASLVRRSESRRALERYATGLVSDLARKTASDMGRALPGTSSQVLQEFLTNTAWEAADMDRIRVRTMLEHASVGDGVLVLDDTGFPKKGRHSVGVTRQYSGTLGRVDNCQVLVTLHYVDRVFDWPVSGRLYLPENWAGDEARRAKARVPDDVVFRKKGEIALDLVDSARSIAVGDEASSGDELSPFRAVVADAGYGAQSPLLDGLEARELPYIVALPGTVRLRLQNEVDADVPGDPAPYSGHGRPPKRTTLADRVEAREASAILAALDEEAWTQVAWRQGTKGALVKECARVRVHRSGQRGRHLESCCWLLGERPLPGRAGEAKQYLVHGLDDLTLDDQIELAHVRWVIERFYQDAKGELGLDDYEGRLWHGFHRHVALVMLAHSFLTLRQSYGAGTDPPEPTQTQAGRTTPPARGFPPKGTQKRGGSTPRRIAGAFHSST